MYHLFTRQFGSMSHTVKIGLVQLRSTANKLENQIICHDLIREASRSGAKMVFLPENFDFIADNKDQSFELSDTINSEFISNYRKIAKENDIYLSLGGFHRREDNQTDRKTFNTHLIIDNEGDVKGIYNKLHLFNYGTLQESNAVKQGQTVVQPIKTPIGSVGLAICYDLRFPELARALRRMSADVLTYPSAFTAATGTAHWHTLLRARAIDNQCFVVAAAQEGKHNEKRVSYGHSMVVDPWGVILAERTDSGPGLLMCDIDLSLIKTTREKMPIEIHRRPDLIREESVIKSNIEIGEKSFQFGPHVIESSCVFYRSLLSFVFVNISPLVPGHVLVSPIRVVERFSGLTPMEVVDLYTTIHKIVPKMCKHFSTGSSVISQQDGPDSGQSVPHVHVHILPRKPGDFKSNEDFYQALKDHDNPTNSDRKYRSLEEMKKEAEEFRKLFL